MRYRTTGPAPGLPLRVVSVPGHRLVTGRYELGLATYGCECGVEQPPAPSTIAAAWRYEHLETRVSKTEKLVASAPPFAHAGKSILEMLWDELDAAYDRLMADGGAASAAVEDWQAWGRDQGVAHGLAHAVAIMTNPYRVDLPAIKAQAHERWEDRNWEPEEDTAENLA